MDPENVGNTQPPEPPKPQFVVTKNAWGKYLVNVQEVRPDGTRVFNTHVGTQHPNKNTALNRIRALYPQAEIKVEL